MAETQDRAAPPLWTDRRLWLMAAFGFMAGLPLPLTGFTLRLWFSEGGLSLGAIGLTAMIGLSYSLKFFWAPVLDRVTPPFGLARFGRRRGWLLAIQPPLALAAALLAFADPAAAPLVVVAIAVCLAFLSSSQDIVIDAWRIETFPTRLQGAALAAYVWGYRAALLVSGAQAIRLVIWVGWPGAFLAMAALLALGPVITLLAREPAVGAAVSTGPLGARIVGAVVAPLRDFLTRPAAWAIVGFVGLFKLGEAMAGTMAPPFFRELGFDRAAIALANGEISLVATLIGVAAGGALVARFGVGRALIWTAWGQMLSNGLYVLLAYSAGDVRVLYVAVTVEAFTDGLVDAAFITYLSGLCAVAYTATQYALLSSLAAVASRTLGGLSGYLAEAVGWAWFYALTMVAALPAMAIMFWLLRRFPPSEARP